mmetsp:Transcript_1487/g.5856  ORF Transcript_1487/g.5856 Transcript_1487/m.5856 type:complete len:210 (+) Transcript_1487:200-829(+)
MLAACAVLESSASSSSNTAWSSGAVEEAASGAESSPKSGSKGHGSLRERRSSSARRKPRSERFVATWTALAAKSSSESATNHSATCKRRMRAAEGLRSGWSSGSATTGAPTKAHSMASTPMPTGKVSSTTEAAVSTAHSWRLAILGTNRTRAKASLPSVRRSLALSCSSHSVCSGSNSAKMTPSGSAARMRAKAPSKSGCIAGSRRGTT